MKKVKMKTEIEDLSELINSDLSDQVRLAIRIVLLDAQLTALPCTEKNKRKIKVINQSLADCIKTYIEKNFDQSLFHENLRNLYFDKVDIERAKI